MTLTNNIGRKLDDFFTEKGFSNYKVAQITGISEPSIGRYRKGLSKPNSTKLGILLNCFPELQGYLTGEGEMLNSTEANDLPIARRSDMGEGKPLLTIEAVAGFSGADQDGIHYADCDHYVVPEFEQRGMDFLIRVSGSSMYPKYSNGDILACKKIEEITFFQWGKIYVIDSNQGQMVKRLFEDEKNPDNVICVSDNKVNYPAFSLPKDQIRSLSIVLGVLRME